MDERHPRRARVRKRGEFRRIQNDGRKVHTKHFLVLVHPSLVQHSLVAESSPKPETRLGITVTKKIGNAAERNRTKRVLREVFRRNRELFPTATDIVVIAKRGAPLLGFDEVLQEMRSVSKTMARKATSAMQHGTAKSPPRPARRTVEIAEKPTKRHK